MLRRRFRALVLLSAVFALAATSLQPRAAAACAMPAEAEPSWGVRETSFAEVISQVVAMPSDPDLVARAARRDLHVLNVMWEDTGRAKGSSIGPNISDLTLQVREQTPHGPRSHLLPVLRRPNFTDETADVAVDKLWVRVGNQHAGGKPVAVPLVEVLSNLREYLSDPSSLEGDGNFMSEKDEHFLVSAQHVFVPLPKAGKAEFNPVLFNYQSAPGSPAVLTLLVTREGTSATIIDNRGGDLPQAGFGQQLFFNHGGQKTVFTAERKSAVQARVDEGRAQEGDAAALQEGADMMMIVQVPLVHRNEGWLNGLADLAPSMEAAPAPSMAPSAPPQKAARGRVSDVEQAVLGHGEDMGPFQEMGGLKLARDERFPIRVTVQFYKATSNGVVSDEDLAAVARDIERVYESGDFVGSLVVPTREQARSTDWTTRTGGQRWTPRASWNPFGWFAR